MRKTNRARDRDMDRHGGKQETDRKKDKHLHGVFNEQEKKHKVLYAM